MLGWIVSGSLKLDAHTVCNLSNIDESSSSCSDEIFNNLLKTLWTKEYRFENTHFPTEEVFCEEHLKQTVKFYPTGRIILKFPSKLIVAKLGDSREIAEHRFYALEKKQRPSS